MNKTTHDDLLDRGRAASEAGRYDEALECYRQAAADQPRDWRAWEKLGELKARAGRYAEAESDFARASALRPGDPSLLYKRARACFDCGRIDDSLRVLGEAAALAPSHPAILRLYSAVFETRAAWLELEQVALDWTRVQPESAPAWQSLARAQWELGYPLRAVESYRTFLDLGERSADTLAIFGTICLHALDLEGAGRALDESEKLDPRNAAMLSAKAMLHMWNGRHDEAKGYCRRALEVNPEDAVAWKTLTQLTNGRLDAREMSALAAIANREDAGLQVRITCRFALGDCHDAAGRIDEAFGSYAEAHRLAAARAQAEGLAYDAAQTAQQTEELVRLFGSLPQADGPPPDDEPIFIIGLPRSGTTLLESVFGAHSLVRAGGERPGIRLILPEYLAQVRKGSVAAITGEHWRRWRETYHRDLPLPQGIRSITDKNPWNFDSIGLILGLFPRAHVIQMRRNPVETGLSIYRNEFSKFIRFAHRLEDIGEFIGQYARVMAHWTRVAAGRFTTVQYEDFVQDFDVAAPALLAACGLPWEPACGEFWKSRRAVATISTMQVRRPIDKASARAQAYAAHLRPLVATLERARVNLQTGELEP